ncbi:MAG: glycoside hydrolase family 88 protein [Bacteroidales bacterium]|nr:glycoside hydrolase family 88 protein [Bacteroidales bacterium]
MLKKFIITLILFSGSLSEALNAQLLPDKRSVLEKMLLANQYFMNKWPDPGIDIVTDKVRPSNIWTRATYYEGLMALYSIDPQQEFYDYAVEWGESHSWEPAYGGITRNADDQCCGQTYIELYQLDNQSERIEPIKTCIDAMVNSTKSDDWWWIDAVQMAMPIFAKLGVIYNDTGYYEKMYDLFYYTKTSHGTNGLHNPADHLWWRDRDFDPPFTTPLGLNCYWSRGNGWVFAALARVLDVLPADAPHRAEYETTFKEMAGALIGLQRYDGFWNPSLVDSNDYGGKETSGTAFFTFGLAWGINDSILSDEIYKPYVIKAWNGMINEALHPDGFLGYVQGTGKQPSDGQPVTYDKVPNFEDYGLGAFLLAGSEVYKLVPGSADTIPGPSSSGTAQIDEWTALKAFPNPFRDLIDITVNLSDPGIYIIAIFDLHGRKIFEYGEQPKLNGENHRLTWNGTDICGNEVPDGIYIIRLQTEHDARTQLIGRKK